MQVIKSLTSREKWRLQKDRLANYGVTIGGISVIAAILLIFFYLLYVVYPLFIPAQAKLFNSYQLEQSNTLLHVDMDERAEFGVRYHRNGEVIFFKVADGTTVQRDMITNSESGISAIAKDESKPGYVAVAFNDGTLMLLRHRFLIHYEGEERITEFQLAYPYGREAQSISDDTESIKRLVYRDNDEQISVVAITNDDRVHLIRFTKEESFVDDEVTLESEATEIDNFAGTEHIALDTMHEHLYLAASDGRISHYNVRYLDEIKQFPDQQISSNGVLVNQLRFLIGGNSLLSILSNGMAEQWFLLRTENDARLEKIRDFQGDTSEVTSSDIEIGRKGFLVGHQNGEVTIYHTTAHREVLSFNASEAQPVKMLINSPRSDALAAIDSSGMLYLWSIHNEHPEISWSSLWSEVHYEGYQKPEYIWQSSSASNDFEPKFSLTPLAFGTLKAAFYAMLFAAPLAIFGAIYTAYFMAPQMRKVVKPTIEIMEALPTVILGFLAGLWLAPLIETHLPGIFSLLIVSPIIILVCSYLWWILPSTIRNRIPDGWEALMLIPVIGITAWLSMALSIPLEQWLFNGDMRGWMLSELGIGFDQRNSLVVGLAMGFAVIPTIFSIAEDAIFSVPKHLTLGSLALGATPWQTLVRVIILTASPGIFSAVMIGMGRAVGETMIVLMATGNTPVMDFSIFEGMRTLAANIAVEMPESELNSTHYRILFLAAFVLFLFTFVFNTLAEIVRHRLRAKYSSL